MAMRVDAVATQRIEQCFTRSGDVFCSPSRSRREPLAVSAVLGDVDHESMESIASRVCGGPRTADAALQSLLHFISLLAGPIESAAALLCSVRATRR
jgi:hypothetical protein